MNPVNVTATFNILQSDFEICNHVTVELLELLSNYFQLQLSKYDCKIRKVTAEFINMKVNFKK